MFDPNPSRTSAAGALLNEPPVADETLRPVAGTVASMVDRATLVKGPLAAINLPRIRALEEAGVLSADAEQVLCYHSAEGMLVERRWNITPAATLDEVLQFARIKDLLSSSSRESVIIRSTDFSDGQAWTALVRYLESECGVVISAQTSSNPHGYFVASAKEGSSGPELVGHAVAREEVTGVLLTRLGRTVVTKQPDLPRHNEKGLNYVHSHGMALAFNDGAGWSRTFLVPSGKIVADGANCAALQYAQSCFEGIVAIYNGDGEVSLFRLEQNGERFARSAKSIGAPELPVDQFIDSVLAVVKQNLAYIPKEGGKLYVRPYLIGMEGGAGANRAKRYIFAVEVFPFGDYLAGRDSAIDVVAIRNVHRPDSGSAKLGANYGPGFALKSEIKGQGYADLLSFDRQGNAEEFSSCAVFFIREESDGTLTVVTPPARGDEVDEALSGEGTSSAKNILPSITRRTVIELFERTGIQVQVRDVPAEELPSFVGAFSAGTAAGITRIGSIDLKHTADAGDSVMIDLGRHPCAKELVLGMYDLLHQSRRGQLQGRLAELNQEWTRTIAVDPSRLAG